MAFLVPCDLQLQRPITNDNLEVSGCDQCTHPVLFAANESRGFSTVKSPPGFVAFAFVAESLTCRFRGETNVGAFNTSFQRRCEEKGCLICERMKADIEERQENSKRLTKPILAKLRI